MQGQCWCLGLWLLVLIVVGCREPNPYRCPDGSKCPPPGGPCASSGDCGAPTPVCNTDTMVCVECTAEKHCRTGEICVDNTCVQCRIDSDCDSDFCLADKTCAGVDEIAYVNAAADAANAACTQAAPCATLAKALMLATPPKYIRATGMLATDKTVTLDQSVAVYGDPGKTKISRTNDGEVLVLKGMGPSQIDLFDLEIACNRGMAGKDCVRITEKASVTMTRVDVHNHDQGGITLDMSAKLVASELKVHDHKLDGIKALAGTTLELTKSQIYNNVGTAGLNAANAVSVKLESSIVTANTGTSGGVSITGPFLVRNSIIANNGDAANTTLAGGANLNPLAAANAQFEFNTVTDNKSVVGFGMNCSVPFGVRNNIFSGNATNNCTVEYSMVLGTSTGTNKGGDPMFVTKTFGDPAFYHIGATSPARDSADPDAMLTVDIDGQARNDDRKDMGADEFK